MNTLSKKDQFKAEMEAMKAHKEVLNPIIERSEKIHATKFTLQVDTAAKDFNSDEHHRVFSTSRLLFKALVPILNAKKAHGFNITMQGVEGATSYVAFGNYEGKWERFM